MPALKQGQFVGSLDCGTTYAGRICSVLSTSLIAQHCRRSVRFIIFDKYANIISQHQLEFPQYYPNPGCDFDQRPALNLLISFHHPRWHDHDANEIQQHADLCVEEAMKSLEAAGWAKNSVKVIGACVHVARY